MVPVTLQESVNFLVVTERFLDCYHDVVFLFA